MSEEERDLINLKIAISPEKYIQELLKENQQLQQRIDKAIEILKLCNSQCAKETIETLKGVNECQNKN